MPCLAAPAQLRARLLCLSLAAPLALSLSPASAAAATSPADHGAQTHKLNVIIYGQESVAPKWILGDGKPQGLCPDVLAAIEAIEPRLHFTGYERPRSLAAIEDAVAHGTAGAACALVESAARHQMAVRLSPPLYDTRYRLAVAATDKAAQADSVRTLDELAAKGELVNTARGSGYIAGMKARGIEIDDSTGDSVTNLRKTLHGHGRYTYLNELSMFYYLRTAGLGERLTVLPTVFNPIPLYFWVSKKADPAVAPAIEAALVKLRANGELARIYARWSRLK
jgi:polar amino acid transport system substrate-binding protein